MSHAIHDFSLRLLDPILDMTRRGIAINDELRRSMMQDLEDSVESLRKEVVKIVTPYLYKGMPREKLFRDKWTCSCCRGGEVKRLACWSCAGFEKKPSKTALGDVALGPCSVCAGVGRGESWTFNPASKSDQVPIVLYDLLKLRRRTSKGKPKADEDTLKDLLAYDTSGLVQRLLKIYKVDTMLSIFKRVEPADDGRIRCFLNPAGTETGRLAGSESFLIASTNLLNMPKTEAAKNPMYEVRRCFVPSEGMVLVEGDLSGAEAWVVAALCDDKMLLEKLRTPGFKIHRWTAAYLFDCPEDDVTPIQYFLGKKARHAGNYGMSWKRLMQEVNAVADETGVSITAAEAKRLLDGIHKLHPGLQRWWQVVLDKLKKRGSLESIFGFTRTFWGRDLGKWLGDTHKEAIAFEPQHTVAYLGLRALLRWWEQYQPYGHGFLLLNVYDSLLLEAPYDSVGITVRALRECLEEEITVNGHTFTIPVEISTGTSWGEL